MKKHLIAAAVAAAVAVPAMAQNVTIYGILDQAVGRFDTGAVADATSTSTSAQNLLSTQRLGFRGTEDLGGGLKANFQIEGALSNASGAAGSALGTERDMWVGLSGNFGAVKLGRTDLGTTNIDDAVSQAGNLGAMMTASTQAPALPYIQQTRDGLGNDAASALVYTTPSFSGLTVELGYAGKTSGAATAASATGVRADYKNGALLVTAGRTSASSSDKSVDATLTGAGVSYNFGVVSVGYARMEAKPTQNDKYVYDLLSAAFPIGNGVTLHGVFQQAERKGTTESAEGYTLAVTKALSKRTTIYAAYSALDNDGAARFGMRGTGAPAAADNSDPSAFALGVRHTF